MVSRIIYNKRHFFYTSQPNIDQCKMENHKKRTVHIKPLSLVDMASAFLVFVLGIGLSLLVFLFECIIHCTTNGRKTSTTAHL